MQPLHANPDQNNETVWSRNVGPERASRDSPRLIEQAGGRLAFGSDWPVVTPDVSLRAVLRGGVQDPRGKARGRLAAGARGERGQRLAPLHDRRGPGRVRERERGSIQVGKRADLVVLSRDILAAPPEEILQTRVLLTLFEGRPVWRDPSFE